jgi:hypothetical protein
MPMMAITMRFTIIPIGGKPLFISRNGRAYKKISGVDLIKLKDKL